MAIEKFAVLDEPAAVVREGGVINDGYDAELDELRGIQNNCGQFLLDLEARERARSGISTLKVEYNRVHGFYIEVTRAQSEKVPDDYRRRQTLKNAERYITPELKTFEDKALSAQDRALAREKLLYDQLLDALAPGRIDLGLGRALGETIAVTLIISPTFDLARLPRILETGGNSISSLIALRFSESNAFGVSALMAAGLVLFVSTLIVNTLASLIVARTRSGEATEI